MVHTCMHACSDSSINGIEESIIVKRKVDSKPFTVATLQTLIKTHSSL